MSDTYQLMHTGAIGNANVTLNSKTLLAVIMLTATLLTGCASGDSNTISAAGNAPAKSGLSLAQIDAVTAAARQMVADPTAQVHGLKSRVANGENGIHVCGYVKQSTNAGTPLYIELRGGGGSTTAERGQVGATPANLAKVRFMCREHGDW